jgi:hypothetical protein
MTMCRCAIADSDAAAAALGWNQTQGIPNQEDQPSAGAK